MDLKNTNMITDIKAIRQPQYIRCIINLLYSDIEQYRVNIINASDADFFYCVCREIDYIPILIVGLSSLENQYLFSINLTEIMNIENLEVYDDSELKFELNKHGFEKISSVDMIDLKPDFSWDENPFIINENTGLIIDNIKSFIKTKNVNC